MVQSTGEVDLALDLEKTSRRGSFSFLGTTADAYFALRKRGLRGSGAHEFVSSPDRNRIAWQNIERVGLAAETLDRQLHARAPGLPDGFRPFRAIERDTKQLADSVAFTLKELLEFCNVERPEELHYWVRGKEGSSTGDSTMGKFHALRSTAATMASLILDMGQFWDRRGVVTVLHEGAVAEGTPERHRGWPARIRELMGPNRTEGARALMRESIRTLIRPGGPRILVIGKSDNVPSFLSYAIGEHTAQVDWWTRIRHDPVSIPSLFPVDLDGSKHNVGCRWIAESRLPIEPEILWECSEDELPVRDIVHGRLLDFWQSRLTDLLELYARAVDYFERRKPVAVICGAAHADYMQVVLQAAKACSVPSVSFQHGGTYGYIEHESLRYSDLRADIFAGYGPEGGRELQRFGSARGLAVRGIGVGWSQGPEIGQVRPALAKGPPGPGGPHEGPGAAPRQVIYAPTGLMGDYRYGPDHDIPDAEYCLEQTRIIRALTWVPDAEVLVKLHPKDVAANPIRRWVRQGNARLRVTSAGRLDGVLSTADLVVIDYPSAPLIEAMAAGKRVVYLDLGMVRWTRMGEDLARDAVYWVAKGGPAWEESLTRCVEHALLQPPPDPRSNAFLDAYASFDFRPDLLWAAIAEVRRGFGNVE